MQTVNANHQAEQQRACDPRSNAAQLSDTVGGHAVPLLGAGEETGLSEAQGQRLLARAVDDPPDGPGQGADHGTERPEYRTDHPFGLGGGSEVGRQTEGGSASDRVGTHTDSKTSWWSTKPTYDHHTEHRGEQSGSDELRLDHERTSLPVPPKTLGSAGSRPRRDTNHIPNPLMAAPTSTTNVPAVDA